MSFDTTPITDLIVNARDAELFVSWDSSALPGSIYQLYIAGRHVWTGRTKFAAIPRVSGANWYAVGVVDPGEAATDFSADVPIPAGGGSRIKLVWQGGLYLDPDLAGYLVYLGNGPGEPVNYVKPVARIAAYTQACVTNGYGMGGYGAGGYGNSSANYKWSGGPYAAGTWNIAVKTIDRMGNLGPAMTEMFTVTGAPAAIPTGTNRQRIQASVARFPTGGYGSGGYGAGGYGTGTGGYGVGGYGEGGYGVGGPDGAPYAILNWNASPG